MASGTFVNNGSGYGLLPHGTRQLVEPMLTYNQQGTLAFIPGSVYLNAQDINPQVVFEIFTFVITITFPRGPGVNTINPYQTICCRNLNLESCWSHIHGFDINWVQDESSLMHTNLISNCD